MQRHASIFFPSGMPRASKQMTSRPLWKIRHSYGVFLYARRTQQFLLVQNRDSQAFLYFFMIRNIETWDCERIVSLLEDCTQDEIQRLLYYPFDELYTDLYLHHDPLRFQKQEALARHNYSYFHSQPSWKEEARQITGRPPQWEFPKGRTDGVSEIPLDTAFRELEEEAGIRLRPQSPTHELLEDLARRNLSVSEWKKRLSAYCVTHYVKPKPYIGQRVLVELYGAVIDDPVPLQYHRFPNHIRSLSLSDECLHGRWVRWEEAQGMLARPIVEVLESVHENLQNPSFLDCALIPCEVIKGMSQTSFSDSAANPLVDVTVCHEEFLKAQKQDSLIHHPSVASYPSDRRHDIPAWTTKI